MCKLKSGIILKNRVFVPEYDSHTDMLEELGIKDDYLNASKTFVRFELSPKDDDVFSDVDRWVYRVDQDITPNWYDEETYKPLIVEKVKEWAKNHIHIGVDNLKINSGKNHYIKDCQNVEIYGNATVKNICGNATVEYICDNATVKNICGNATVKYIHDNATVENICGNATVKNICDSATVIGSAYCDWKNKDTLIIADNATFKDCYTKTIYQSGDWKLVAVSGKIKDSGVEE